MFDLEHSRLGFAVLYLVAHNHLDRLAERNFFNIEELVLVKMLMSDEYWYIIKNIRGVTGFVGSGTKPTPLTEEEILQLGMEKKEIIVNYDVGDNVRIVDGPLTSFTGIVDMLDVDKNKVRVIVSMFGRETPAELELDQVEPIEA